MPGQLDQISAMLGGPGVGIGGGGNSMGMGQPQTLQANSFEAFLASLGLNPASIPPEMMSALRNMWMEQASGQYFDQQERRNRAAQQPKPMTNPGQRRVG